MKQHHSIGDFLDSLVQLQGPNDKPWYVGQIFLVNLFDSHAQGLVEPTVVAAFLRDCVQYTTEHPDVHLMDVIRIVSLTCDERTPRYMRRGRQPQVEPNTMVSTVVKYSIFVRYHYDDKRAELRSERLLPNDLPLPTDPPPPALQIDVEHWRREVRRVTRIVDWHKADARLGPEHGNCWISVDQFIDPQGAELYGRPHSDADRARDELGLIDWHDHIIKYSFSGATCLAAVEQDVARPTFADGGNPRFATWHRCPRFEEMAQKNYGCTFHLGRFPLPEYHPPSGRPECVTRSIKLSELEDFKVDYLSATTHRRGDDAKDDDAAFLSFILTDSNGVKRNIQDIKQAILQLATASGLPTQPKRDNEHGDAAPAE